MQPLHRKRRRTFNEPGHAHYLTYSCVHGLPLLSSERSRQWVVEAIGAARERDAFDLFAYIIMPEHVHLLLRPRRSAYDMARLLYDLKRPVSWKAKSWLKESGETKWLERLTGRHGARRVFRFWQPGGGFDRNIVSEKGLWNVVEYIHANPVRRGLVERPTDWRWSSAGFWAGDSNPLLRMDAVPL